jgi:hypothetical protein
MLKNTIEKMSRDNQIEVLRILVTDDTICINQNSNGTFINLANVNDSIIKEIEQFMTYINKQQTQLNQIECQREILSKKYFKEDKDNSGKYNNEHVQQEL